MLSFTHHPAPKPGVPRVALIHSLALDRSVWDDVVARLKDEAEILTFDCRGHGRSPRTPGPYAAYMFARDLAELLDHVGWAKVVVDGCDEIKIFEYCCIDLYRIQ